MTLGASPIGSWTRMHGTFITCAIATMLDPHPMTPEEIASLHDRFRPHYRKLAYYRGVG